MKLLFNLIIGLILAHIHKAEEIPLVDVKKCSTVFKYKELHVMGCTDIDSEGQPWCLLRKPIDKHTWAYCDLNTLPPYLAEEEGTRTDCDVSSSVSGGGSVYGCFSEDGNKGYKCKSNGKLVPCLIRLNSGRDNEFKRPANNRTLTKNTNSTSSGPDTKSIEATRLDNDSDSTIHIIMILGILGGIGVISALVVIFLRRRNNNRAKSKLKAHNGLQTISSVQLHKQSVLNGIKVGSVETLINQNNSAPVSQIATPNTIESATRTNGKERIVVSTYTPTLSDELIIKPGDKVMIYKEYDDGWAMGVNLSRGAVKGVFPMHCIEPLSDFGFNQSKNGSKVSKRSSSNIFNK